MKKNIGWGIVSGAALIYPTIRTTRKDAIKDAFASREIYLLPTPSNLKAECPWLDVVKVTITWERPQ